MIMNIIILTSLTRSQKKKTLFIKIVYMVKVLE
jgi:hypothetical protein